MTQVKNSIDSTTLSQYDYANDNGGRRTSVKHSGSAFETGPAFNLYGYNSRSEVVSGNRYWGANLNDTSDPVSGQSFGYAYDNIGNRSSTTVNGEPGTYQANALNQYTSRTVPDVADILGSASTNATVKVNTLATSRHGKYWHKGLAVTNSASATYAAVEVIGIDTNSTTNTLYSIETGHVFVAKTPEAFSYDDDGNLLSDGRFNYSWDNENRLVSAETLTNLPSNVPRVKVEFSYDYMSRRVSKSVYNWISNSWSLVETRANVFNGWDLIREKVVAEQATTNCYFHGLDLSGSLSGAGGIGGLLAAKFGTNTYLYTYCANGNVSELVDADTGTTVAHYEYSPFGQTIVATGPMAEENEIQFSTKPFERRIRKVLYEYRIYDPETGRWLSRDPIGERGFRPFIKIPEILKPDTPEINRLLELKEEMLSFLRQSPIASYRESWLLRFIHLIEMELETIRNNQLSELNLKLYLFANNNAINLIDPHGLVTKQECIDLPPPPCEVPPPEWTKKCQDCCSLIYSAPIERDIREVCQADCAVGERDWLGR